MSYKLVIAEKPSVAQSIAKVIGADKREDGYLEGNGYIVSWCVGHLVELAPPESYNEKYEKWRYEDLPILPSEWNYQIAEATRKQFGILKKLMEREDVTGLVEATDAGREGELIFRLVYDQAKCKKPFERLWISSMEDQAISDGFSHLKNGREYDDLYRAALCRERADWIVGMNATRLFSTLYGQTLNVGRVMTPTLAMIVQREAEIDGFKPEPIYRLSISCGGITALSDRFEKKQDAENILNVLKEQKAAQVTKIDPADKQEKAPQLYSLTALQRDANRFLGFTAQQTLDYTQSLYEKKLVTYPRTDSRFLTEDMENMIPDLAGKMAAKFGYTRKMAVYPKQVINNSKVSDHHAIIPTVNVVDADFGELPSGEQKVLSLITARLLSALGNPAVRNEVDVEFTCADTVFRAKAKNIREKGWRDIQEWIMGGSAESTDSENDRKEKSENADMLACIATLTNGKSYPLQNPKMEEGKTTPKKHFTEDSLLSAMERAETFYSVPFTWRGFYRGKSKKVIAGEKEPPERNEKVPERKEAKPEKRKFDLVVDIQKKMAQGKNGGYVQWTKKYNVKQFAESILFLQQHAIHDKKTLDALVDGSSAKYHELMKTIKDAEEKMAANKVIKTHIINYAKTRETYITYRKSGYSKKFFEAHRDEITLHKAAKEAFSKLPDGKIPKVKELNEEFARLLSEKKAAYSEYKKIKKEMRDYQIAKQNVESFYAAQQIWNQEEDLKKKRQQQR